MKKSITFLPIIGSILLSPAVVAETNPMTIVVTSSRTAENIEKSLAPVTVITRADIDAAQSRSLEEVLNKVPGLAISNSGGAGKVTSVFLRGTESDQVLVLVDGIKVGSVTSGTTTFQDIPLSLVDRIEVVRGPRSSLYGSEAIGGVIQIFTRRGEGPVRPNLSVRLGRYDTATVETGLQGGDDTRWFNLSLSSNRTNGFNSCDPAAGAAFAGCFTSEPDNDGYENTAASFRAGFRPMERLAVELHLLRSAGDSNFDGSFVNGTQTVQFVGGAALNYTPEDARWGELSLSFGRNDDKSDNLLNGAFKSRFNSTRDSASLQDAIRLNDQQHLTLGLDYLKDSVNSDTAYTVTERENNAVFALYQFVLGRNDLDVSLRHDENQQFGGHTTGNLAWGYRLEHGPRLTASYGTAFKAPTFNELYFPGFSNPNLGIEKARSLDIGAHDRYTHWGWSANIYETRVSNLITLDSSFTPANLATARIRGLELAADGRLGQWSLQTHVDLLNAKNRQTGSNFDKALPRRPNRRLRVNLGYDLGPWTLGSELLAEDGRYDDIANNRRIAGYGIVNLNVQRRLNDATTIQASIENVFDKAHETVAYFNQAGRGVYFTLRYVPQN